MGLKVGELIVDLRLDKSSFDAGLKSASSKIADVGKSMSRVGVGMTKSITAPIVAIGVAAVATVAKFDDSMSKMAASAGLTADEFDTLRVRAKNMGSTTAHSASAAADGMYYLASSGMNAAEIYEAIPQVLDLASAGALDLGRAAEITTAIMGSFGLAAADAGKVADALARTASETNTNINALGEGFKYAGPAAKAAGMDINQTSAILGVFAKAGITGGQAGTTFVAMLNDMKKKSKDGQLAIGEHSVALYDAAGNMRDMGTVMADIGKATANMTTQQKDAALGSIFQSESLKGVNNMLEIGVGFHKNLEAAIYDSSGAAKEMADIMESNIGGALRQMKSQLEGIVIDLGDLLVPIIINKVVPALQSFGKFISGVIEKFNSLSPTMKAIIGVVVGLVAAAGPLLVVLGTIIQIAPLVGAAITFMTGPIGIVIVAIAALVAGLVYAYTKSETFRDVVKAVFGEIGAIISRTIENIKSYFEIFTNIITGQWGKAWDGIVNVLARKAETLGKIIGALAKWIPAKWHELWTWVADFAGKVWGKITDKVGEIANTLIDLWAGGWQGIVDILRNAGASILNWVMSIATKLYDAGKNLIGSLVDGIMGRSKDLEGIIEPVIEDIVKPDKVKKSGEEAGKSWADGLGTGLETGVENMNINLDENLKKQLDSIAESLMTKKELEEKRYREEIEAFNKAAAALNVAEAEQNNVRKQLKIKHEKEMTQIEENEAAERTAKRDAQRNGLLESIKKEYATESELEAQRYEEKRNNLLQAFEKEGAITDEFFALRDAIDAEHEAKLLEIETGKTEAEIEREAEREAAKQERIRASFATEEMMEAEHYNKQLASLQLFKNMEGVTAEQFNTASQAVEQEHMDALAEIRIGGMTAIEKFTSDSMAGQIDTVMTGLKSMASGAARQNKVLFKANKAAAIADALVSTYKGVSKTMGAYPFPINIAMAAASLASGMAQVQSIRAQSFAKGGLVTGPVFGEIGEGMSDEAVLPLNNNVLGKLGAMIGQHVGVGGGGGSGGRTVNIQVMLDGKTIAQAVEQPLAERIRVRSGIRY